MKPRRSCLTRLLLYADLLRILENHGIISWKSDRRGLQWKAMRGGFGVALSLFVIALLFVGFGVLFRLGWNKSCMRSGQAGEQNARE